MCLLVLLILSLICCQRNSNLHEAVSPVRPMVCHPFHGSSTERVSLSGHSEPEPVFPEPELQCDESSVANPEREREFQQSRSSIFNLFIAIGYFMIVFSDWACYVALIFNHMRSANIISLAYPLFLFLWGMLSVPRPTKTFWIFVITYTEVSRTMCVPSSLYIMMH